MKKTFLRIMNVIFIAVALFGVSKYATTPLLTIGIDAKVDADTLNPILNDLNLGSLLGSSGGETPEIDLGDYLDEIEFIDENGTEGKVPGIALSLSVKIDANTLLGAFQAEDKEAFVKESLITPNIDAVIGELKDPLANVVKGLVGSVAAIMIEQTLQQVATQLEIPGLDGALDQEVVSTAVSNILGALIDEDSEVKTVDDLSAVVLENAGNIIDNLNENGVDIPEDALDELPQYLETALTQFGLADEEGNILDMDVAIATLLGQFTGGDSSEESGDPQEAKHFMSEESTDGLEESSEDDDNQLTAMLVDLIMEKIEPHIATIANFLQYGGYALLVLIGLWALFILKCFIKMFTKNPGMKNHIFFWIHLSITLIFLVLHLGLSNLSLVVEGMAEGGVDITTTVPAMADVLPIIRNSSIVFESSLVYSAYILLGILAVCLVIYGPVRHSVKKDIKREKKALKAKM